MAIEKIKVEEFIQLSKTFLLFDVRSPSEFEHAHIPSALNLPIFTDEQRAIIGTAYKQKSKEIAIKLGLDFFGLEMRKIVEKVETLIVQRKKNNLDTNAILVHCWRGGMRSEAVAWLLNLYGFKVYLLSGGYKGYRNLVLKQFELPWNLKIIGGYTGSGKTLLLKELEVQKYACIDLEKLANHKGSALGALGQLKQPSQEMFENLLAGELLLYPLEETIFLEDESQRIGNVKIPDQFFTKMRNSSVVFLKIPFDVRLAYLTLEYGVHPKDALISSILRIQKRLGGLETKNAVNFLVEDKISDCFKILLTYYDRWYLSGLYNRENAEKLIIHLNSHTFDVQMNCKSILHATDIKNS